MPVPRGEAGELGSFVGGRVRIWQLGLGEGRALWERELARGFWGEGELIKRDDRGREVRCSRVEGERVAVKIRPLPGFSDRLRFRLGLTDLGKAALGAAVLTGRGLLTPRVRVLAMVRPDYVWHEVLVTPWAEGPTLLSAWATADLRTRLALARTSGDLIATLSRQGLFNRDAKPSNVILDDTDGPVMVDVGGVRLAGGDREHELARMVSALGFEPAGVGHAAGFREVFAGVRAALRSSGVDRQGRRRTLAELRRLIAAHADPRPKDNPLAHGANLR